MDFKRPEPMTAVDAAWLRMETPDNPMTITSIMFFDQPLDHKRILDVSAVAVANEKRMRQRIDARRRAWITVPGVDLDAHIDRVRLPAPAGDAELRALVNRLSSPVLGRGIPPWRVTHVEGFRGGSAVVTRLHHAIGDGAALMRLLLSLSGPGTPEYSTAATGAVLRPADLLAHKGTAAVTLARLLAQPSDPATSLHAPLGIDKRFAWSEAAPLAELQDIAHDAGATTNDVILTALAGALRRMLHVRGERTHDVTLHAIVPVNLRAGESDLGNRFGLVFAPLPLGIDDPRARLAHIAEATARIRRSPEAAIALLTLAALGRLTPGINERLVRFFGSKGSLVVTNVRGPQEPITYADTRLARMVFFAPQSARMGMGASILSYAGQVRMGLACDANVCAEPSAVVDAYGRGLAALGVRMPGLAPLRAA